MQSVFWRLWLIKSYEYAEGAVIPCNEMLENARKIGDISLNRLGRIVKDVWGTVVNIKRVGYCQETSYENLQLRKEEDPARTLESNACHLENYFMDVRVPEGWAKIHKDSKHVSFLKLQRPRVEISLGNLENDEETTIKLIFENNVITVIINDGVSAFRQLSGLSLKRKVMVLQKFIDISWLCEGIDLPTDQDMETSQVNVVHNVCSSGSEIKKLAHAENCYIFCFLPARQCEKCLELKRNDKMKKLRKEERVSVHWKTNKRYLSKAEVEFQVVEEKRKRKNAEKREFYWKNKFELELIEMEEEDHSDLLRLLNQVNEKDDVPENLNCMWEQQKQILQTSSKNGYRWHPKIMRLCLDLYCKNPHVLDPLRDFITLPSKRTIRHYKNKVEQSPGWNDDVLLWCKTEAKKVDLKEDGYWGGFVIDEMKIQEDLEMIKKNGKHRLVGFINLGKGHESMTQLMGNSEPSLASQVLQFLFLSDAGFRFPIAQFPSGNCTPSTLYLLFWEGVMKMREKGFVVYWCILDGADCNRQFIKIHFQDRDPVEENFTTVNFSSGEPMVFLMDPKHNIKKIRNNIQKSNEQVKPRCLKMNGKSITWKQFVDAYNWDQKSFSLPIHEQLTQDHFELDSALKMRNHLAEDVLNHKMLFLMQKYPNSTVMLLQHTAEIIGLFSDKLPISAKTDVRLKKLNAFYIFLVKWWTEMETKKMHFVSTKLWFDLQSMCLGFQAMVAIKLSKFRHGVIKPAIINQDCVENHFCQVRACNGQNNHPTYYKQESVQNSI